MKRKIEDSDRYEYRTSQTKHENYPDLITTVIGEVILDTKVVGKATGYLLKRLSGSCDFHLMCDCISDNPKSDFKIFFGNDGQIKPSLKKKLVKNSDTTGSLLYIQGVSIHMDHRGMALGLKTVNEILNSCEWSIALIKPFPEKATEKNEIEAGIRNLSQYFARLGFKQCDTDRTSTMVNYWYLQFCSYINKIKTKEAIINIPITIPIQHPIFNEATKEIKNLIHDVADSTESDYPVSRFLSELRPLQERGGDVNLAVALHSVVANQMDYLILPLLLNGRLVYILCVLYVLYIYLYRRSLLCYIYIPVV